MACQVDITDEHCWFIYESKQINITVLDTVGDPVDLTGLDLQWRFFRTDFETVMITKVTPTEITVGGVDTNIAQIFIEGPTDYQGTNPAEAGSHRHELWDRTNEVVLASGKAVLLRALLETLP